MNCECGVQLKEIFKDGESLGFFCPTCINPIIIEMLTDVDFKDFNPEKQPVEM